ncbi:MAG: hypothetical protein KF789_03270 [Bdellovibrionaceae bacterium]|nr:hypothetical protein [Pseudobdellovibrionaceae bacterium]
MTASKQRMGFLSNLARVLGLALVFMSLLRFLFYWNFSERFSGISGGDLLQSFAVGIRFDLLVLGFLLIPVVGLAPFVLWTPRHLDRWMRTLVVYLCSMWVLIVGLSFADFLYFSAHGQRLSLMAVSDPLGREVFWSASERLGTGTLLMNAGIFFLLVFILNSRFLALLKSPPSMNLGARSFWKRWVVCLFLTALAARGTVTAHHLEWQDAKISEARILWELTINSPWAWDKNPERGRW